MSLTCFQLAYKALDSIGAFSSKLCFNKFCSSLIPLLSCFSSTRVSFPLSCQMCSFALPWLPFSALFYMFFVFILALWEMRIIIFSSCIMLEKRTTIIRDPLVYYILISRHIQQELGHLWTLPGMPGLRGRMAQRSRIEANTTGRKINVNEMMPNDIRL